MISENPQDDDSVCCYYDNCVDARLQNRVARCVLHEIGCVMADACHTERENEKADGHSLHQCNFNKFGTLTILML